MMNTISKTLALAACFCLAAQGSSLAKCIEVTAYGQPDFEKNRTRAMPKTNFLVNEQIVLCVTVDADYYVSIWDAPPFGQTERLFPNRFSHPNSHTRKRAERFEAGKPQCFGDSTTFPMYMPPEEKFGRGKVSILASAAIDAQPALDEYALPGLRLKVPARIDVGKVDSESSCTDTIVNEYLFYDVTAGS